MMYDAFQKYLLKKAIRIDLHDVYREGNNISPSETIQA